MESSVFRGSRAVAMVPAGNSYKIISKVPTGPGARTSLYVPEQDRIYIAAPAKSGREARILEYKTE